MVKKTTNDAEFIRALRDSREDTGHGMLMKKPPEGRGKSLAEMLDTVGDQATPDSSEKSNLAPQANQEKERMPASLSDEKKTIRLNLDLSAETHKALKVRAAQDGVTVADIVRNLVTEFLSK